MTSLEGEVCEDIARQAAFLWLLRDHAVKDVAYDLADLARLDDRLEASLDALRLADDVGWAAARDLLSRAEGGEVFGAAVVAIERWDLRGLARVLDAGARAPDVARGLASAFGWTSFDRVEKLLPGLLGPRASPALMWLGITACAVHRRDPGPALGYAIGSPDPRVRARALRAAGETGRVDLRLEVVDALNSEDPDCRFWAAWTATLFGEESAARALWEVATVAGPLAERAASTALRRMDAATGHRWIQALGAHGVGWRVPMSAAASLGDPIVVPWLIECMATPAAARLAGAAFTMITGVDLAAQKLAARAPEGFHAGPTDDPGDEDVAMDPDESLPWPSPERVATFWRARGAEWKVGTRHLFGRPATTEWLEQVLRRGHQTARAAAALELSMQRLGKPLFEVRAPARAQRRVLAAAAARFR